MAKKRRKATGKRRTIGENPLDSVVPHPSVGIAEPRKKPIKTQTLQQTPDQSPAPDSILPRVECMERENQCMKWLVGAVLAPLALLALLL